MIFGPEYDSFDPDIPDGLQVEVYDDHTPPAPDDALHDMIDAGNRLWAAMHATGLASRPLPADSTEPQ